MFRFSSLTVLAVLVPAGALAAQQNDRYTLAGSNVAVYNLAGTVRLEPGTGTSIIAEITRGGPDAGQLRIETGRTGNRETLTVIYPGDRIVYAPLGRGSRTDQGVKADGTFGNGGWRGARRVTIAGTGEGIEAHADMRILVPAGKTVAVHLVVGRMSVTNVSGNLELDVASADVDVSGTRGSLTIDVGSGNTRVTDVRGELSFDTGSGDVTVSQVRAEGLLLDTGSGNVTVTDARAARIEVDAGSGDIVLNGLSAPIIELETGSGEIDLTLTADTDIESLSLESGSGDVTIRAPASLGARVDIESGSGDVSGDLLGGLRRDEDDRVSGTIGDGSGTLSIETGSGDVRVVRLAP